MNTCGTWSGPVPGSRVIDRIRAGAAARITRTALEMFPHQVQLLALTTTRAANGEEVKTWSSAYADVYAVINRPAPSAELRDAGTLRIRTDQVTVSLQQYYPDVVAGWRFTDETNRLYLIDSVNHPFQAYTVLKASYVSPRGDG